MATEPLPLFPASEPLPLDLRARELVSRGRTEALCRQVVPPAALSAALGDLGPVPGGGGALMVPADLINLAAVARMVREDLRMLGALLATIASLPPAEQVTVLRA